MDEKQGEEQAPLIMLQEIVSGADSLTLPKKTWTFRKLSQVSRKEVLDLPLRAYVYETKQQKMLAGICTSSCGTSAEHVPNVLSQMFF